MPSVTRRVEDQDVAVALTVERQPGDLELADPHVLAVVGPDRRGIVDRVALGRQLEVDVEHRRPRRQPFLELVSQVVLGRAAAFLVADRRIARRRDEVVASRAHRAVGGDELEGVQRVVRELGVARRNRRRDRRRDRRNGLRMLAEERADLGHVGRARLRVGPAHDVELDQLLGRAHEEARQGDADDVGGPAVEVQLHGDTAGVAGAVGNRRVAAAVGEAHVGAHRLALEVDRPADGAGGGRGRERRRAQHALGVGGAVTRVHAVRAVQRVDKTVGQILLARTHASDSTLLDRGAGRVPHHRRTAAAPCVTAVTPTLAGLAHEGGSSIGRAVMTSATYPNHATFATGVDPTVHRLLANWVVVDGRFLPASEVGPAVPTIFDACRASGRSTAAVVGDQHLIHVMGADAADEHWPANGVLADDVERDGHGYAADHEVLPRLLRVFDGDRPDLVVGHLNEPDTAAHMFGPDSEAALATYRSTDACVAEIVEALRPTWRDTVFIAVSDHDQETVHADGVIDLYPPAPATGLPLIPIPEGSAAIVWGDDTTGGAWLDQVGGVTDHHELWPGARLVGCEPGRWFCPPAGFMTGPPEPGTHGGVRTRSQVAIVAGGHPDAIALAKALSGRPQIEAAEWAPTLAGLLSIDRSALSSTAGSSLLPKR